MTEPKPPVGDFDGRDGSFWKQQIEQSERRQRMVTIPADDFRRILCGIIGADDLLSEISDDQRQDVSSADQTNAYDLSVKGQISLAESLALARKYGSAE